MCFDVFPTQDEWVVCRIFQKNSGGKRSFLFSNSHMQQREAVGYHQHHLDDARSSLPPMVENSPNPTVTDDEACTDCDTCAGTDQMSCYNCVPDFHDSPTDHHHNKDSHGVMSWLAQPTIDNNLLHHGLNNLNTMLSSKSYHPLGLSPLQQQQPNLRVASLRPKTEPSSLCEGEDEAQSIPKGFDYSAWPAGDGALYHCNDDDAGDAGDPSSSPLQSSTNLSCLTGSLCSGSENMNFTYKYRLQDVTAPVDSGLGSQEILWAY